MTVNNGECWEPLRTQEKRLIFPGWCWFWHSRMCWKWLDSCWLRTSDIICDLFLINVNMMVLFDKCFTSHYIPNVYIYIYTCPLYTYIYIYILIYIYPLLCIYAYIYSHYIPIIFPLMSDIIWCLSFPPHIDAILRPQVSPNDFQSWSPSPRGLDPGLEICWDSWDIQ